MFNSILNLTSVQMYSVKCLLVFVFFTVQRSQSISTGSNETAEILWNLSNLAVQSRQNFGTNSYYYKYPGKYPQYYKKNPNKGQYGLLQYPGSSYPSAGFQYQRPYPQQNPYFQQYVAPENGIYPYPSQGYPARPFNSPVPIRESFMDALYSVAQNDDLHCVPKLLCEITSGTLSGSRQQGFNLPFNINTESLIGLLSAININGGATSPLLLFGKAALLGYTSKGNTASCNYAYPKCPLDPDRLVQYLNNHNGGFFRFFNGINQPNYPPVRPNYQQGSYGFYPGSQKSVAEQRIQNKPIDFIPTNNYYRDDVVGNAELSAIKFPVENDYANEFPANYKSSKGLKFPSPTSDYNLYNNYEEQPFRKPKELPFSIYYYHNNEDLDIQRPLPNHKATPMIFPDRTGTGDLRLDPEELKDKRQPFALQNNNIISFHPDLANDAFYYTNFNGNTFGLNSGSTDFNRQSKSLFSFPSQ